MNIPTLKTTGNRLAKTRNFAFRMGQQQFLWDVLGCSSTKMFPGVSFSATIVCWLLTLRSLMSLSDVVNLVNPMMRHFIPNQLGATIIANRLYPSTSETGDGLLLFHRFRHRWITLTSNTCDMMMWCITFLMLCVYIYIRIYIYTQLYGYISFMYFNKCMYISNCMFM